MENIHVTNIILNVTPHKETTQAVSHIKIMIRLSILGHIF